MPSKKYSKVASYPLVKLLILMSSSSSISWVGIHFDGSCSSISWISVHRNTVIGMFSIIIIHFNLLLELILILVIQAGNDESDQCSNNKCDNKCDHYTDSNCYSCRELIIIWFIISCTKKECTLCYVYPMYHTYIYHMHSGHINLSITHEIVQACVAI